MSGGDHGVSSEDQQHTAADPISTEVQHHEKGLLTALPKSKSKSESR